MPGLDIRWELLKSIIGGLSAIDVPRLNIDSHQEAVAFLECYGFDIDISAHREEIENIRVESILLIEEDLLQDIDKVPEEIRDCRDVCQLLLWASAGHHTFRQLWACALLRVMHTLAHTRSFFNEMYGKKIRQQIIERLQAHLFTEDDVLWLGEGPRRVRLMRFDIRPRKSARSIAIKLLHKAENVAADIFDRIGVRFVTPTRLDCVRVVRYLREQNVVMFANIKPSRSRNTLLDLDAFRELLLTLEGKVEREEMSNDEAKVALEDWVQNRPYPAPAHRSANPFSSLSYQSIQLTCRQMIRLDEDQMSEDAKHARFFFPFEVQILDNQAFLSTRSGLTSHQNYKERQRKTVRRRVLGPLDNKRTQRTPNPQPRPPGH